MFILTALASVGVGIGSRLVLPVPMVPPSVSSTSRGRQGLTALMCGTLGGGGELNIGVLYDEIAAYLVVRNALPQR